MAKDPKKPVKRRPHVWVSGPDEYKHSMYTPWMMSKAQANFRGEGWDLPFEEFFTIWDGHWENRGRGGDDYCLTRLDPSEPWSTSNCQIRIRKEHLAEQNSTKEGFRSSKTYRTRGMDIHKRKKRIK